MATNILAYGEATFIDLNDADKLSAYITSNQPTIVVYDPNSTSQYTPDWSTSPLLLTPVVLKNNEQLSLTATGVEINWKRRAGSGEIVNLIVGETVVDGVLKVTKNVLSSAASGIVTYICNIAYTDPDTSMPVETQAQMSFSLVKNATELKDCSIIGDNTFKYNGEGTLVSASSIELTANLTNTSISQWQYKKADGSFAVYPNSTTSTKLTIKDTDNVFFNDIAVVKLVTTDSSIFDVHQIIKLRDGAAGSNTYTCVLSNDSQSVPTDADGKLFPTSLNGCNTTITIYEGSTNDTANWTITPTPSAGIVGNYDKATFTYTVTDITVESGYVEFIATRSGYASITKRFTIIKERSGSDGKDAVIYQLKTDVAVLKLNSSNVFVPTAPTFSAYQTIGNTTSPANYSGRFKIYESTNGSTYTLKYTSGSDEQSKKYTPTNTSIKTIKCELYSSGGTTALLDTQVLSIVSDGIDGETGKPGIDAVNSFLGNWSEVIPCNTDGTVKTAKDITIPYSCYQGTKRIGGTATVGLPLPSGITEKSNNDASTSSDGVIVLTVEAGAKLATAESGDITITIVAGGLSSTHKFTWTKNIQSENGENAVLFQIFAPQGDVIINSGNNVILETTLLDGSKTVVSGVTYEWAEFTDTGYTKINGETNSSLTVTPSMVDSVAAFRCIATYKERQFAAYWCVTDKSDPCSLEVYSSLGDKLVNSQGVGAVYAIIYRGMEEIDPIKSTTFSTTEPTKPATGDFYYKVDKTAKSVTLMKYNGTTWVAASGDDLPKGTYSWYRRDLLGKPLDTTTPYATGKAVYLDSTVIDKKVTFRCKFEL